jgi:hypothetical protein
MVIVYNTLIKTESNYFAVIFFIQIIILISIFFHAKPKSKTLLQELALFFNNFKYLLLQI